MRPSYVPIIACAILCGFATTATAHEFRVEGKSLTAPEGIAEKTTTARRLVVLGTPFGVNMHVECTKIHVAAGVSFIEPTGKSVSHPEFSNCTVVKPVNCTLNEPVVARDKGLLVEVGGAIEEELTPAEGAAFTTVTLTGSSCSLKGKPFEVGGSQLCELPEAGTEKASHEGVCKVAGSSLKAGGKAATLEGSTTVKLESGKLWSAL
jgi:hypothetical protein